MVQCPICGVTIFSSDNPENVLKNHRAEQHPDVKPVPTFRQGFEFACEMVKGYDGGAVIAEKLLAEYKEPE